MHRPISALAAAGLLLGAAGAADAALIWQDEFARSSSSSVGNGWSETENDANDVGIVFDNYLLLRDNNPDAAATRTGISTLGYENITVEFRWRPWDSEGEDRLTFRYQVLPDLMWTIAFDTDLGGHETYRTETVVLDVAAADTAALDIRFALDATYWKDAAKIDYVRIYGTEIADNGGGPTSVSAPGTLAGAGLGILGLAALGRRRRT
jgi:MYXO-CTERM domain-containing protein